MTYVFPGYLGPQLEKHGDQGNVMVGNQNHLKICFLTVWCLGWDSLKIRAAEQSTYMWPVFMVWLLFNIMSPGQLDFLHGGSRLQAQLFQQMRQAALPFMTTSKGTQHLFHLHYWSLWSEAHLDSRGENIRLPPGRRVAGPYCREGCGIGDIVVAIFGT